MLKGYFANLIHNSGIRIVNPGQIVPATISRLEIEEVKESNSIFSEQEISDEIPSHSSLNSPIQKDEISEPVKRKAYKTENTEQLNEKPLDQELRIQPSTGKYHISETINEIEDHKAIDEKHQQTEVHLISEQIETKNKLINESFISDKVNILNNNIPSPEQTSSEFIYKAPELVRQLNTSYTENRISINKEVQDVRTIITSQQEQAKIQAGHLNEKELQDNDLSVSIGTIQIFVEEPVKKNIIEPKKSIVSESPPENFNNRISRHYIRV